MHLKSEKFEHSDVALNILPVDIKEVKNDADMAEEVETKSEIKPIISNTIQNGCIKLEWDFLAVTSTY